MKIKLSKNQKQFLINSFIICCLLSFVTILFLKLFLPNKSSQDIASTVGGILGTTFSFFGSVLVYFALKAQIEANRLIQKQFNIQQFESKLFKMLDMYNINVDNLKFKTRKKGIDYEGKAVFPHLISNYNSLKKDIKDFDNIKHYNVKSKISNQYFQILTNVNNFCSKENWILLELTYIIFLYGTGVNGRKNIKAVLSDRYESKYISTLLNYLSNRPVEYESNNLFFIQEWNSLFLRFNDFNTPNNQKFDKYYNGHQNNLAHYYRHLFMIVKFINEQDDLSYHQKWEYSKLLRAQLSNHEQELFFLNSISIVGREWELNQDNENYRLITKFDLIKNISKAVRDKYRIEEFYTNVVYEDYAKNTIKRENFEINIYS